MRRGGEDKEVQEHSDDHITACQSVICLSACLSVFLPVCLSHSLYSPRIFQSPSSDMSSGDTIGGAAGGCGASCGSGGSVKMVYFCRKVRTRHKLGKLCDGGCYGGCWYKAHEPPFEDFNSHSVQS